MRGDLVERVAREVGVDPFYVDVALQERIRTAGPLESRLPLVREAVPSGTRRGLRWGWVCVALGVPVILGAVVALGGDAEGEAVVVRRTVEERAHALRVLNEVAVRQFAYRQVHGEFAADAKALEEVGLVVPAGFEVRTSGGPLGLRGVVDSPDGWRCSLFGDEARRSDPVCVMVARSPGGVEAWPPEPGAYPARGSERGLHEPG